MLDFLTILCWLFLSLGVLYVFGMLMELFIEEFLL